MWPQYRQPVPLPIRCGNALDVRASTSGFKAAAAIATSVASIRPPPATERGIVWNGEVKPEQADDGADQSLSLPQREAKDRRNISAVVIASAE